MKIILTCLAITLFALAVSYATGNSWGVIATLFGSVVIASCAYSRYERDLQRAESMRRHPAGSAL